MVKFFLDLISCGCREHFRRFDLFTFYLLAFGFEGTTVLRFSGTVLVNTHRDIKYD